MSAKDLAARAEELGMSALALTDHGNMFGAMEFISACKSRENPVKPIVGCEVYVSPGSRFDKKGSENDNHYYHLILLATNRQGYFNLVKLCSLAYTEGFYKRPRVDEELLSKYSGGLIALSACVSGEIPRLIRAGKTGEAEQKALHYRKLFGTDEEGRPNFFLEIQDHGIPAEVLRGSLSQSDINKEIAAISRKTGIPLVATNDVHYLEQEDNVAHDVLLCIGTGKLRAEEKRKKYYKDQFYFKSGEEMAALFSEYPQAVSNTVAIAARCNTDVPEIKVEELPNYLPKFEVPAGFSGEEEYLRRLAADGLVKRYAKEAAGGGEEWQAVQKRLDYELDIIIQMKFTGYFLIVADFVNWAKKRGIPVGPGRGSGAGSIAAYALRITDIEPLKYGLLFERFLNPERISMPDFDIDFANEGRDDVIKYVTEKYGNERVGQIITFGTLGAKAVIKDVARVLNIPIAESEMITKLIPKDPKINTLEKAFAIEPKLHGLEADSKYADLFKLARKLEGLNRHSSLHAAGVVIGKTDLIDLVPLYRDSKTGAISTQYDMNHLEKCGLVKMDFLGIKTLDVIKRTEDLVRRRGEKYAHFDIEAVSEDDETTFKMLGEGKSFEIFQFESEGMQRILQQAKPGKLEDLIALNALYRPGPMAFIPRFVDSKHGRQKIVYPDPSLEETLKETYGVVVYQEQVMQVARIIAGYTMGQADLLRRAMGKKKKEIIDKEKVPFLEGALKQGYSAARAGAIYDMLAPFAGYGFNKSHAAGYAVLAYRTAYLKANFPAEFMAANLTNEIRSTDKDKLSKCIDESRKMGIQIDPPDVNHSDKHFSVVEGRIVYGLLGIKGIGDAPADEIVRSRTKAESGTAVSYKDFMDFLDRVDLKLVSKSVIEKLIQTGAFDSFGISRENLLGNLERAFEYAQKKKEDRQFGQTSLFEDTGEKEYADFVFENFPEWGRAHTLKTEKQLIGFYFSGHPLDEHRQLWEKAVKVDLGKLDSLTQGSGILVGIVKNIKSVNSKNGRMAYASLADFNGEIEMIFFTRVWDVCQDRIQEDEFVIVSGQFEYQENKEKYSFVVKALIGIQETDAAIAEEEERHRKWEKFRITWEYSADLKSGGLAKAEKGTYTVMGILGHLRETKDRNGNEMAFGTLKDFEGDIDLVFFSKAWAECRDHLKHNEFAALRGSIDPATDRNPDKPSVKVTGVADFPALSRSAARKAAAGEQPKVPAAKPPTAGLPEEKSPEEKTYPAEEESLAAQAADSGQIPSVADTVSVQSVHIRLDNKAADKDENLSPLRNYLGANPGPCPVFIHIPADGGKTIRTKIGINLDKDDDAIGILKGCTGVIEVWTK